MDSVVFTETYVQKPIIYGCHKHTHTHTHTKHKQRNTTWVHFSISNLAKLKDFEKHHNELETKKR